MTRAVMILITSVLTVVSAESLALSSPKNLSDSSLAECCNLKILPLVKLKSNISHSKQARKLSHKSHAMLSDVKQFFAKRRQKRHFRHFAHMTSGRKVSSHSSAKMLKESSKRMSED
jgi:hypothetical protein